MKLVNKLLTKLQEELTSKIPLPSSLNSLEKESLLQALADKDINAKIEGSFLFVDPSDSKEAKVLVKRLS